jgi:hypothetical protein
MLAHMKGHEGNLPARTQIQSLRISGLMDGASGVLAASHPFVSLCPSTFALGGTNPIGGFYLTTLSFGRPLGNCGAHFGYNACIPSYRGRDMRGVGETYKRIQHPLLHSARAHYLDALAVTPWGH